jgi:hypothetical protein
MSQSPLNLTARDFDAYAPEKATSNAYSRPRLEVKQRALAWARGVIARLAALGIPVDVHGSDEHLSLRNKKRVDNQWVFFWRDAAAREELDRLLEQGRSISQEIDDPSPYTRHAFLALRIDVSSVEVCFAVHPEAKVDVDNLHARLDESAEGAATLIGELMSAFAALPEEFKIGVGDARTACASATPEAIRSMLERAAAGQVPLWIGWSVGRKTALEHAALLDEQLEDALIALAPIYKLVAWSRDNDRIALDRRLEGVEKERARTHAEAQAQTERWRIEQAEARRRSLEQAKERSDEARRPAPLPAARRSTLATLFNENRQRDPGPPLHEGHRGEPPPGRGAMLGPKPPHSEPSPHGASWPSGTEKPPAPEHETAAPRRAEPQPEGPSGPRITSGASIALEKGARVRVLSGPFAEKVGVLSELDGRGGARVLLGLLSTRLELTELEPSLEGRERPALQTSHRRPLPPAPRKAR